MKKTILFLAFIASIFVACEPQPEGTAKEEVYGTWVCENKGFLSTSNPDAKQEDLLFLINEKNATFISEDSIAIRHGYWGYTEDSDLGYITYRYELTEEKKLILTTHNKVSGKDSFFEFTKRPDLDPVIEYFIADEAIDRGGLIDAKEFLGKWEWVATENLDSSNTVFAKHVMDTLENAVFEFVPNTAILFYDGSIVNNNRRLSLYSMPPYRVIMSNKEKGIIADWAVAEFANGLSQMLFRFPIYNKNNELMGYYHFGGSHYFYSSLEKGKMVLSDRYSDTKITFKKVE
jgi:hypothetical protein